MFRLCFSPLLTAVTAGLLSSGLCAAETLRILNWEEYLSDEVIALWQQETGVRIEQVYFDSDEIRDQILNTSQKINFDLAIMDQLITPQFGNKGTIVEIPPERIPNLSHIGDEHRNACSRYGVPYAWGMVGIIYRSDKVTRPESWNDLLTPAAELQGHISMLYDYLDTLIPPLQAMDQDFMTEDRETLKQAFEILKKQAPSLLTLQYPISFMRNSPQAEQLYMGMAYSGDQYVLNEMSDGDERWKFTVPGEGGAIWRDCLTVMAESDNKAQALAFIDFLNRPHIAAMNAESLYVAPVNHSALTELSSDFLNDTEVFPGAEVLAKSQNYRPISSESVTLRKRITGAMRKLYEAK
ncbi:polyamine ABC transporter substrate-binding protein [Marinobacterium jannaschii]|uniref:polyamine ABC transporter substrate-binding protein n=1 Tax=Marinobacterium jannaschii TaxID=64970 RepID=UPI000481A55A|nr:spermidine/putrescine ABC transporter substrate-binding protein [Marinobacterium jannaschii]